MAKLFIEALLFGICFQLAAYLFWAFNFMGGTVNYPYGNVAGLTSVFSINAYSALAGVGAAVGIGIAALLLKQGVYAIFAMLLFGIGIMFNFIGTFFLAIPNVIGSVIPASANPLGGGVNPIIVVITVIFFFAAWMYMFGLVIQR